MTWRRAAAAAAAVFLMFLLLRRDRPSELSRRAGILFRSARLDSKTRSFNGTAAAFDRQFFVFLESTRRNLPQGAPGVAILGMPPSNAALYLATYHLAPTPVLLAPKSVPAGWFLAVYGAERPPGGKVIAPVWKGVLMTPSS